MVEYIISSQQTGTCVWAPANATNGNVVTFSVECADTNGARWLFDDDSHLVHASTQLCIMFSPLGVTVQGNMILILSDDCSPDGPALRFAITADDMLQNLLNPNLCVQPLGGIARHNTQLVMAWGCTADFNLRLDFIPPASECESVTGSAGSSACSL